MWTFLIPLAIVFIGANLIGFCLARAAAKGDWQMQRDKPKPPDFIENWEWPDK